MKRFVCIIGLVSSACVDSGCPKGSVEVSGTCMTVEGINDGGVRDGGEDLAEGDAETRPDTGAAGDGDGDGDSHRDAGESTGDASDEGCALLACGENAHCEADGAAARCVCDEGYQGDGENCEADPCAAAVNPCDPETTDCVIAEGQASCECKEGWARCDGDLQACSTDLQSDASNCGACGAACAGNLACDDGACEQRVKKLALGQMHSCALSADDDVLCWGNDDYEQLQRAAVGVRSYEPARTTIAKSRALGVGLRASCAITLEDEAVCWGDNVFNWTAPGPVEGLFTLGGDLGKVDDVRVGLGAACLIVEGEAGCWGIPNSYFGATTELDTFEDRRSIRLADDIDQMSLGYYACAVSGAQRVNCWGQSISAPVEVREQAGPLEGVLAVAVAPTRMTGCAVLADGRVTCWGSNRLGMLGNVATPLEADVADAVAVTDEDGNVLRGFQQVAVGSEHACAIHEDGEVFCWGKVGQLGAGGTGSAAQPFVTDVTGVDDAIEIAAGSAHSCVRRRSGQVQCWGDNSEGQLGVAPQDAGGIASSPVPVDVIGLP